MKQGPIETQYRGYRFRSRLEARWAIYFDAIGLKWDYEIEGFHFVPQEYVYSCSDVNPPENPEPLPACDYLPDFYFPILQAWAEIKPEALTKEEEYKAYRLSQHTGQRVVMLIGAPEIRPYPFIGTDEDLYYFDYAYCGGDPRSIVTGIQGLRPRTMGLCEYCLYRKDKHLFGVVLIDLFDVDFSKRQEGYVSCECFTKLNEFESSTDRRHYEDGLQIAERAVAAARSARFEHGETPADARRIAVVT